MNKVLKTFTVAAFIWFPFNIFAQDSKKDNQTEEITIRKKGDKEMNLKVEINGDKIIVNGKPLAEFKDDQIIINKRKMIIRDGDDVMNFDLGEAGNSFNFHQDFMKDWNMNEGKEASKAFLGVTTEKCDEGAKIMSVSKESAAEKAGLKKGDIITNIGDEKIEDGENLADVIAFKKPKDEIKIGYKRNGKEAKTKAILGEKKRSKSYAYSFNGPEGNMRSFSMPSAPTPPNVQWYNDENLDELEQMGPAMEMDMFPRQKKLGLKIQDTEEGGNVKVINVEDSSAAAIAGLKKDDIITEINGKKIENTDDAREQLQPDGEKKSYAIKAKRNGTEIVFDVKIPKKLKTANL
jgi:serine protease Do